MYPPLTLISPAWAEGEQIPSQFTCDADNVSPPLLWFGWPSQTQTFALLCEDPDSPKGPFSHWVVWNIPMLLPELPEAVDKVPRLQTGAMQGRNDFGQIGYGGPCPPTGRHRYFFRVYALDATLKLDAEATRAELLSAMQGHLLAEGKLMGTYQRDGSTGPR